MPARRDGLLARLRHLLPGRAATGSARPRCDPSPAERLEAARRRLKESIPSPEDPPGQDAIPPPEDPPGQAAAP